MRCLTSGFAQSAPLCRSPSCIDILSRLYEENGMNSVPEEWRREVSMSNVRKIWIILWPFFVALVPISCSKHKPNNKAALAIAREQELARQQREVVVQQKEDS